MTEHDIECHTGNLRITKISFDTLAQMWDVSEYDAKVDAPIAKFYIGKIGKFCPGSYISDVNLRCASIVVNFENGYDILVAIDDVEFTDIPMTPKEFLPDPVQKTGVSYMQLSQEEKDFADRMFLQLVNSAGVKLINSGGIMQDDDIYKLYDRAIMTAIYRTAQHNLFWDKSWVAKLDI